MTFAADTPLATHLRGSTRQAHHALDHHALLAPLVRPALTVGDYARALAALHGPHGALEKMLDGFAPRETFPPRLSDLVADLDRLGVAPFPVCVPLPVITDIAAPGDMADAATRCGFMYVVEGSNLGAAVIARQLAASLPAKAPRRFFSATGKPQRWHAFWRLADTLCPPEQYAAAAAAAREAFGFYRRHLDDCLARPIQA